MSNSIIDSANGGTPETAGGQPKRERKTKKAKLAKKAGRAKKPAGKPKADRTNKKAEVIAMMKRAKGATLAEIMKATGWQAHTFGVVAALRHQHRTYPPRPPPTERPPLAHASDLETGSHSPGRRQHASAAG